MDCLSSGLMGAESLFPTKTMAQNKPKRIDLRSDEYGLNKREFLFCLFMLACQGKKPRWAAGQAGFSGDLARRSRSLLEQPVIQKFLTEFSPPVNKFAVKSDRDSLIKRLEQIASSEGVDKTVIAQLKAIELMGKAQGLWEGTSSEGRDRLREIQAVFAAGPVERGSLPCSKCNAMCPPLARFCQQCGAEIEREKSPTEKLMAAKKKVGKAEVIQ
jgi:ribosomal protein L40E